MLLLRLADLAAQARAPGSRAPCGSRSAPPWSTALARQDGRARRRMRPARRPLPGRPWPARLPLPAAPWRWPEPVAPRPSRSRCRFLRRSRRCGGRLGRLALAGAFAGAGLGGRGLGGALAGGALVATLAGGAFGSGAPSSRGRPFVAAFAGAASSPGPLLGRRAFLARPLPAPPSRAQPSCRQPSPAPPSSPSPSPAPTSCRRCLLGAAFAGAASSRAQPSCRRLRRRGLLRRRLPGPPSWPALPSWRCAWPEPTSLPPPLPGRPSWARPSAGADFFAGAASCRQPCALRRATGRRALADVGEPPVALTDVDAVFLATGVPFTGDGVSGRRGVSAVRAGAGSSGAAGAGGDRAASRSGPSRPPRARACRQRRGDRVRARRPWTRLPSCSAVDRRPDAGRRGWSLRAGPAT